MERNYDAKGEEQVISKIRTIAPPIVVAVTLSTLCATSASADWFIGGAKLAGSASISAATVGATSTLLVPALKLSIVCSGQFIGGQNARINAGDKAIGSSLSLLECNTTVPASGCALQEANQPIFTNPILARAFLGSGTEDRVLLAAESKGTLTEVAFNEANTCAFNGLEPVKGELIVAAPTGQSELSEQPVAGLGSTENNSLEFGSGNKAFLDGGRVLLTLAGNSKWSFK